MLTQKTLVTAAAIAMAPMAAFAGSVEISGYVAGNVIYDNDLNKTDDYIDAELTGTYSFENGFYAGANLYFDGSLTTDDVETSIFVGFANDISDKASYDLSIANYWYNDTASAVFYDVTLGLMYAVSDAVGATLEFNVAPDLTNTYDHNLALEIGLDKWTVIPTFGIANDGTGEVSYGELEFIYDFGKGLYAEVDVYDDDASLPTIGVYLGYEFTLFAS
jgi:hypothetical protein